MKTIKNGQKNIIVVCDKFQRKNTLLIKKVLNNNN